MKAWLGFAAGLVVIALTGSSVVKTFLIPRGTTSALNNVLSRAINGTFRLFTRRVRDQAAHERIWGTGAPLFLLALLAAWLVLLLVGFGLILWPFTGGLGVALREAGSSVFTLGFAAPHGLAATAIVFAAAASGLAVLALLIAYLPVLYASFNRRETLVTMLEALAGAPPWGPELLARNALILNAATLPGLYERWTEWAADISESHINYRTLIYFRSPDPSTSWLLSLLAVLDAAALHLSLNPESAPPEARPLLRVGYLAMRRISARVGLPVDDDPKPDGPLQLTRAEFDKAVHWLSDAGWTTERSAEQAWPQFRGWRVNYESAAYQIAMHLDLPPAYWSGPRRAGRPAVPPRRPTDRRPRISQGSGP